MFLELSNEKKIKNNKHIGRTNIRRNKNQANISKILKRINPGDTHIRRRTKKTGKFIPYEANEADRRTRRRNFADPLKECGLSNFNLHGWSIPGAQMVEHLEIMGIRQWVWEVNGSERANELEKVEPGKSLLHPAVPVVGLHFHSQEDLAVSLRSMGGSEISGGHIKDYNNYPELRQPLPSFKALTRATQLGCRPTPTPCAVVSDRQIQKTIHKLAWHTQIWLKLLFNMQSKPMVI